MKNALQPKQKGVTMKMNIVRKFATAGSALLVFAAPWARADIADGAYSTDLTGVTTLWDISGSYSGDVGLGIGMDFSLTESPSGALKGSGSFDYDGLSGTINVTGTVAGSGANPRVTMDLSLSGSGSVEGQDVSFTARAAIDFDIDVSSGALAVTSGSLSVRVTDSTNHKSGSKSVALAKGSTMALPDGAAGGWSVSLNLAPKGDKYSGSATVVTDTGTTAELAVTGNYEPKSDTSNLTLKGPAGNVSLVVSTAGGDLTIHSLKGKLFGQSLSYKAD